MKECLICGENLDDHAMRCSKGHSLFKPPRTATYSCDTTLIEEILRQSSIGYTEHEIVYLVDEITRILSRNRSLVTKEKVETIGRNLKRDLIERKRKETERKQREEAERWETERKEAERRETKRKETERKEAERRETERKQREEAERRETERKQREEAERKSRKEVEEILRQSSIGYTEDEIIYLIDETIRILSRDRILITEEKVETIGRNLRQDLAERRQRLETIVQQREEAEPRHMDIAELDVPRAIEFLLEHFKNANLQRPGKTASNAPDLRFNSNQDFWRMVLEGNRLALRWIELTDFKIVDWFPRTPGLFYTHDAERARLDAQSYIVEENGIRFYDPHGKMQMIEGGTGSVRFKPLKIDSEDCWLCTATSDRYCHSGIPLAVPNHIMQRVDTDFHCRYKVTGQIKFLPRFLSEDYLYHMSRIPQMYVFANAIELLQREDFSSPVNITPMVFFNRDLGERGYTARRGSGQRQQVGSVTYVTCRADKLNELDRAADWLAWYAERYGGEVITNFDEQRPTFSDAPFSLQNVMSGNLDRNRIRDFRIEHADIVCDTIHNIHSEATTMTQIDVRLGNGITIHGDFVVANSIKDSFNKVSSSSAPDELKESLKKLATAVGKMTEQLPNGTAQQVARDLDTLVAEATSPAPRKQWWELSVEGLKQAAQDIGEIGKPVLELVGLLVPLLLSKSS